MFELVPPHVLGRERAAQGSNARRTTRRQGGVRGKGTVDRQTEEDDDDFVTVEDSQTVDIKLDDHPDGGVAVRVRPGLILTRKHAAVISRAWRDSKNPNIVRPRNEDERPPDASAG